MSKAYALSGARVAHLCGAPELVRTLRHLTPPLARSLVAQLAAVTALGDPHYATRYAETATPRALLTGQLRDLGRSVGSRALRIAVKDEPDIARIVSAVRRALR